MGVLLAAVVVGEPRKQKVVASSAFGNPSEDALLLVRFEVLDRVDNCAHCFEIILRCVHTNTFPINNKRKDAFLFRVLCSAPRNQRLRFADPAGHLRNAAIAADASEHLMECWCSNNGVMPKTKRNRAERTVLRLPDLEQ